MFRKITENIDQIPNMVNITVTQSMNNLEVIKLGLYSNLDDMMFKIDKKITSLLQRVQSNDDKVTSFSDSIYNIIKDAKSEQCNIRNEIKVSADKLSYSADIINKEHEKSYDKINLRFKETNLKCEELFEKNHKMIEESQNMIIDNKNYLLEKINKNKENIKNLNLTIKDLRSNVKENFGNINDSLFQSFENLKLMISVVNQELSDADEEQQQAIKQLNSKIMKSIVNVDNMK